MRFTKSPGWRTFLSTAGLFICVTFVVDIVANPTASREPVASPDSAAPNPVFKPYKGEAKAVKLPSAVTDVALGGHGRYLLLYLQQARKIAVYDANKTKIVRYLPVTTDDAKIVAGDDKLIVVNTTQGLIERWSLDTWKRETVRPLPFSGVFKTMALGYGSNGPLLMHRAVGSDALASAKYLFIDLNTLQELPGIQPFQPRNTSFRDYVHIRAAGTGNVFGLWATSHSPQGLETLVLNGTHINQSGEHSSAGHICPNFDGTAILTGAGLYTVDLKKN